MRHAGILEQAGRPAAGVLRNALLRRGISADAGWMPGRLSADDQIDLLHGQRPAVFAERQTAAAHFAEQLHGIAAQVVWRREVSQGESADAGFFQAAVLTFAIRALAPDAQLRESGIGLVDP